MTSSPFKHEGWLYGLAFLIAIAFRFIALGASPLTDSEAALALQSLAIARGESPLLAPQSAYILFTAVLFAVVESTNFLARFLPALAGSLMVFAPYFFREKIHPRPALILAFLFAFDPGLVAMSRQANGTILAAAFLLFAWAMWNHKRLIPAGIFAGLALLSGPSIWAGILSLAVTRIFLLGAKPSTSNNQTPIADSEIANQQSKIVNRQSEIVKQESQFSNSPILLSFFSTLLLAGTLFFIAPNGLSAALASIPAYLSGWVAPTVTTPGRTLFAFFAYEPLGVFLASLAVFRAARMNGKRAKRLLLWLGVSLLLAAFYRQPGELVWAIIPLLTLSAFELTRVFEIQRDERVEVGIVVAALSILTVYAWYNTSGIALDPYTPLPANLPLLGEVQNVRPLVLTGSLLIIAVCIALIALGWSARIARLGVTLCFSALLAVYSVAAAWGASGLRDPNGFELWTPDPRVSQADLLLASVNDLSEFSLGHDDAQPVTVVGILSPALEWTLRNRSVEEVPVLDPQSAPPILITTLIDDPGLPAAYRGQDFTWRTQPQWVNLQPQDWLKWLIYRELPSENETIILWARDDLFPDAREGSQP